MKTTSQEHIQGILSGKSSPLQKIFAAYESHQNLQKIFIRDLPEAYQNQVSLVLYKAGVMTLGTNNSALFSRLSYEKSNLFEHFKKKTEWAGLREIKLKILV